jgi:hypothetical protein
MIVNAIVKVINTSSLDKIKLTLLYLIFLNSYVINYLILNYLGSI